MRDVDQTVSAEILLRKSLKHTFSEPLIELYGKINTQKPAEQLRFAERLLKQHPENPQLLLCLGRLAMQACLWGKAKYYLEASVKQAPSAQSYEMLGKVTEHLGDRNAAFEMYRRALEE